MKQTAVQDSICENFDYHFTANLLLSQEWKNFENRLRNDSYHHELNWCLLFWDTVYSVWNQSSGDTLPFATLYSRLEKWDPTYFAIGLTTANLHRIKIIFYLFVKWHISATLTLNSTWILLSFKRCSILSNCCDKLSCRHADVIRDVTACWHFRRNGLLLLWNACYIPDWYEYYVCRPQNRFSYRTSRIDENDKLAEVLALSQAKTPRNTRFWRLVGLQRPFSAQIRLYQRRPRNTQIFRTVPMRQVTFKHLIYPLVLFRILNSINQA